MWSLHYWVWNILTSYQQVKSINKTADALDLDMHYKSHAELFSLSLLYIFKFLIWDLNSFLIHISKFVTEPVHVYLVFVHNPCRIIFH